MIVSIKIQNFLSFGNETITLRPDSNLIAGINGGGKSNFIRAARLLYEAVSHGGQNGLRNVLNTWGGFDSLCNMNSVENSPISLIYELDFNILKGYGYGFLENVIYEIVLSPLGDNLTRYSVQEKISTANGYIYLTMNNGRGVISKKAAKGTKFVSVTYQAADLFKDGELVLGQISDPENYSALNAMKKAIENIDIYEYFNTLPNSKIRTPSKDISYNGKLVVGGDNLASVLNELGARYIVASDRIMEELKTINPNFRDIRFNYLLSTIVMTLREHNLRSSIGISNLSDGTLRFLCLLAILCNPTPSSLICLDEPEMGLHPDMIATLARLIKEKSRNTQIIITTHSPLLLNHFDFENVLFFEKNDTNNTTQKRYNADDFSEEEMVGSLWMKGYLGGRRW